MLQVLHLSDFGLASFIIGVERGWIGKKEAYDKVEKTMDTFLNNVEGNNGFFYHFIDMENGKRVWNSEVSIIDTGIFICGAITAGEYFGGKVKKKAEVLYRNSNWKWYTDEEKKQFYMGYKPENGFFGHWDMYAEQLMLYVLGIASPTFPIGKELYEGMDKPRKDYGEYKDIICTYNGTLFTYQFSHAWIDFFNRKDGEGIDWFENSVKATKADREFCIENPNHFKTFGKNAWGLTACLYPKGYNVDNGAKPSVAILDKLDGTIPPCGAIGSIVFTPKESLEAMNEWYEKYPEIWGEYGFKDAYNLEGSSPWFAEEYLGIDKGISMVMLENYLSGLIWKYSMKNKYIQKGLKRLAIEEKN